MEGNASEQQIVNLFAMSVGGGGGQHTRILYPVSLNGHVFHREWSAGDLVCAYENAKAEVFDLKRALHAAGEDLGNAKRNLQNDQEASANIIRQMRSEIDELKRRNENQAAMIHAYWTRQAATEHDYQKLVNKLAAAEQRIAGMEADLAEIREDEAAGDETLGDRAEFEDVDTYSELATEAVRLADEVQGLKARQSKGVVWLVIDEEMTLAAAEKVHRLELNLRDMTSERDKLRDELKVERLKSDMERTRARIAENMAFCARNPPAGALTVGAAVVYRA